MKKKNKQMMFFTAMVLTLSSVNLFQSEDIIYAEESETQTSISEQTEISNITEQSAEETTSVTEPVTEPVVVPQNTYTLVVPSTTAVTSAGYNVLDGGLRISDGTLAEGKQVKVTVESANSWKFISSDVTTTIRYTLVNTKKQTTTTYIFSGDEAKNGAETTIGVNVNLTDYERAAVGHYTDTITFKSIVMDATV